MTLENGTEKEGRRRGRVVATTAANSHVFRRAGRPVRGSLSEGAATMRCCCVPSSFDPDRAHGISRRRAEPSTEAATVTRCPPNWRPILVPSPRSFQALVSRPEFPRATRDGRFFSPPPGGVNPGGGNTRSKTHRGQRERARWGHGANRHGR